MEAHKYSHWNRPWVWLVLSAGLFSFYYSFHNPLDYSKCSLCDGNEYQKVYDYFEHGTVSSIKFPFYTRPFVPLFASWVPGSNMHLGFYVVNLVFVLLGVLAIWHLWKRLKLSFLLIGIGMAWLLIHWSGIIRYNQMDMLTVDVPVYFTGALALIVLFSKKLKWFYLLTPLAILQKESFTPIMIVLIIVQLYYYRKNDWWSETKHLILSLCLALIIQKLVMWLLPEQSDQRNSVMTLLWHLRWALEDPTRIIRHFAAFGCAFGIFPIVMFLRFKKSQLSNYPFLVLVALSLSFIFLGISAGEDMTRIMFLGFPFIMTISLIGLSKERLPVILAAVVLSLPFMRLFPFYVDLNWSVDYAPITFVYQWAGYYALAIVIFTVIIWYLDRHKKIDSTTN